MITCLSKVESLQLCMNCFSFWLFFTYKSELKSSSEGHFEGSEAVLRLLRSR